MHHDTRKRRNGWTTKKNSIGGAQLKSGHRPQYGFFTCQSFWSLICCKNGVNGRSDDLRMNPSDEYFTIQLYTVMPRAKEISISTLSHQIMCCLFPFYIGWNLYQSHFFVQRRSRSSFRQLRYTRWFMTNRMNLSDELFQQTWLTFQRLYVFTHSGPKYLVTFKHWIIQWNLVLG